MDSGLPDPIFDSTPDPELLQDFIDQMEQAGFRRRSGSPEWTGPVATALSQFTHATAMTIFIRPGWPYFPPGVRVAGIDSWHANRDNLCLWQTGDDTRRWVTLDGIIKRIAEWAEDASAGFPRHGLALDPHLYFAAHSGWTALINIEEHIGAHPTDGQTGNLKWTEMPRQILDLHTGPFRATDPLPHGIRESREVIGRWFFRDRLPAPPRNLGEFQEALTDHQRERFDRDLRKVFRQLGLFVLFWGVPTGVASLILFAVKGETGIDVGAVTAVPKGKEARILRAGPDSSILQTKTVLIVGAGAIGSHVAQLLARSAVGRLRLVDYDSLWPANLIRHAAHPSTEAGELKVHAMVDSLASYEWTIVEPDTAVLQDPANLRQRVEGVDLAIDATGDLAFAELMSRVAVQTSTPFVTVALYRGGSLARVRRGAESDRPIAARRGHAHYPEIEPAPDQLEYLGLEAGCMALINNAPPVAVVRAATLAAEVSIDQLTGRRGYADEIIEVYRPTEAPFDRIGTVRAEELPIVVGIAEAAQAAMRRAAREALPNETGGVLIGVHIDGHPVVTDALEIPTRRPAPDCFVIAFGEARRAVEAAAAADRRVGYVGEWHSHPTDQGPSPTDRWTMLRLASDDDTGNPILVVVRPIAEEAFHLDVYRIGTSGLVPASLQTVGGLPPLDAAIEVKGKGD